MRTVIETFKETLIVWVRLLRFLVILNLAFLPPDVLLHFLKAFRGSVISSLWGPPLGFALDFFQLVFDMASVAALFGLLKSEYLETKWATVWTSVGNYTWRLFWMVILATLIGAIPLIGAHVSAKYILGIANTEPFLQGVFYLVFFLWALGAPLVVMENLEAKVALKRSWGMIVQNPVYVLCCLTVPSLGEWSIRGAIGLPTEMAEKESTWLWVLNDFILGFAGSAWGILFWTMCLRMKTTRSLSVTTANQSPPESPAASQSA